MVLRLSPADLARLQHAQTVLLSPLDHASPEAWGVAACGAARSLLGAQQVSLFATGEAPELWFTSVEPGTMREFLAHYAGCDPVSRRVVERGIECACAWDVVDRYEFQASEFFNDFAGPNQMHDAMGMRIPSPPQRHLWLTFQHERPLPEPEVRRRVALMQLLLPAFKAGARIATVLPAREPHLARLLDRLPQALLVASAAGRVLHENAALSRLLAGAAQRELLRERIGAVLLALLALRAGGGDGCAEVPGAAVREVEAGGRRYRITGSLAGEGVLGPEPVLLVQVEAVGPPSLAPDELRRLYGLTPREVEVALLLAERRSNREVAEALRISPHTAERHTERVLGKLGVRSRLQVPARVAGE